MAQAIQRPRPRAQTNVLSKVNLNLREGWIAGGLVAIMLVSATASVATANWTEGLGVAMWAAIGGLLFAALVTRLRLNQLLALLFAIIVGAAFTAYLASSHVGPPDATWNEKMILIEDRIDQWFVRVFSGGVGTDAFIFLILATALAWHIGYLSGWSVLLHHQPWGAIIPIGSVLLINLFYAPPQSGMFLMIYLLAALLLLVRMSLLRKQQTWAYHAVRFASDIGLDFLTYGVVFSGLIILIAWLIPPTSPGPQWFGFILDRVRSPWENFQQDMTRAFSTVRGVNTSAPTTFFSNSLAMGGPIRLGDRPVFDIDAEQGRYWRAVVFDKYTGTGWVTTADTTASFIANDPRFKTPPMGMRRAVSQTVTILLATDNLVVSAAQPFQIGEPTDARFSVVSTGPSDSYIDLHALRLARPPTEGFRYNVLSSVSGADEDSLRTASKETPNYVRERYLQLPGSVPPRVRDLAFIITANATNDYDKARAIEKYLREKIKYNENVQPAPIGRDGVDYLLFDRPEGYCNYYASAMAVLAREVGIPARVASGYAVGRGDDGIFHVNESNAHSWPELYIGEMGWIEFEPTSARPEIVRPVKTEETQSNPELNATSDETVNNLHNDDQPLDNQADQSNADAASNSPLAQFLSGPLGLGVSALALVAIALAGSVFVVQYRWQRKMRGLSPAARALEEMYRFAPLAGFRDQSHTTADERADNLVQLIPDGREPVSAVNGWYVRERYGAYELSSRDQRHANKISREFQPRVWGSIFNHHVGHFVQEAYTNLAAREARLRASLRRLMRRDQSRT